jgi:hypothetical protein
MIHAEGGSRTKGVSFIFIRDSESAEFGVSFDKTCSFGVLRVSAVEPNLFPGFGDCQLKRAIAKLMITQGEK